MGAYVVSFNIFVFLSTNHKSQITSYQKRSPSSTLLRIFTYVAQSYGTHIHPLFWDMGSSSFVARKGLVSPTALSDKRNLGFRPFSIFYIAGTHRERIYSNKRSTCWL